MTDNKKQYRKYLRHWIRENRHHESPVSYERFCKNDFTQSKYFQLPRYDYPYIDYWKMYKRYIKAYSKSDMNFDCLGFTSYCDKMDNYIKSLGLPEKIIRKMFKCR